MRSRSRRRPFGFYSPSSARVGGEQPPNASRARSVIAQKPRVSRMTFRSLGTPYLREAGLTRFPFGTRPARGEEFINKRRNPSAISFFPTRRSRYQEHVGMPLAGIRQRRSQATSLQVCVGMPLAGIRPGGRNKVLRSSPERRGERPSYENDRLEIRDQFAHHLKHKGLICSDLTKSGDSREF